MICYRDVSFCSDAEQCKNRTDCRRYFSEAESEKAWKWWGCEGAPVAFMSFKETCNGWVPA